MKWFNKYNIPSFLDVLHTETRKATSEHLQRHYLQNISFKQRNKIFENVHLLKDVL